LVPFGYNRVPIYISLRTVQKNRWFTAATIIIHHSRRWWIQPTYASSTEHQHRGGCSPRTVTPRWQSVLVVPVPTTRTKQPPDRWSYSTAVARRCERAPAITNNCLETTKVFASPSPPPTSQSYLLLIWNDSKTTIGANHALYVYGIRWKMNRPVPKPSTLCAETWVLSGIRRIPGKFDSHSAGTQPINMNP